MPTPQSVRLVSPPDDDEKPEPAARAVLALVSIVQDSILFNSADVFPALVTHEDGTESIALTVAVDHPDHPGQTGYGVLGILFSNEVSSPAEAAYAIEVSKLVVAAIDVENAEFAARNEDENLANAVEAALAEDPEDAALAVEEAVNRATDERYAAESD